MKLWIARDGSDCSLWCYDKKPLRFQNNFLYECGSIWFQLPTNLFPEVTFENSPQQVEIKLI